MSKSENPDFNLLGKLDPQKALSKPSRGNIHDGKNPHFRHPSNNFPKGDGVGDGKRKQRSVKPSEHKKFLVDKEGASSDGKIYIDVEDLKIAELEKKLGLDKRKSSKLGDDELDG